MNYILRLIFGIVSYILVIYGLDMSGFLFGIEFIHNAANPIELFKVYALIGIVFWLSFTFIRWILKILLFPLNMFFFGVVGVLVNISVVYICQFLINFYLEGVVMHITGLVGVLITSVILGFLVSIIYWILKQI